jgi:small subunit ribosomal protein S21
MPAIVLQENDRVDWAIKNFRRQVQRSGILKDARRKRYYLKPSTLKRMKRQAARRRRLTQGRRRSGS